MILSQLQLPNSGLNKAVDEIISALESAQDSAGARIFSTVERGLMFPVAAPGPEDVPCCTIWHEAEVYKNESVQFYPGSAKALISLYLYFYSFDVDSDGVAVDIQSARNNITRKALFSLFAPDDTNREGLTPSGFWGFIEEQSIGVEHINTFKDFAELLAPVKPPWYVSRIRFEIWYAVEFAETHLSSYTE